MRLALCCFPFCGIIETLKNRPKSKQSPLLGTWTSVEDGDKGCVEDLSTRQKELRDSPPHPTPPPTNSRISNGFLNVALSQDAHCLFPAPGTDG